MKRVAWAACAWVSMALVFIPAAQAAVSCNVNIVTLTPASYSRGQAMTTQGWARWSCTRTDAPTDGDVSLSLTASAGTGYSGSSRNAFDAGSGSVVPYRLATSATSNWGDPLTIFGTDAHPIALAFGGAGASSASGVETFTMTLPAGLNPVGAAIYRDTLAVGGSCVTTRNTACAVTPAVAEVIVTAPALCGINAPLAPLSLAYQSFQTAPATSAIPLAITCTNGTPYQVSLTPANGSLLGLPYALKVGARPNDSIDLGASRTLLSGTGFAQAYFITGTIDAGLPGTCALAACSASVPHGVVVEY